MFDLVYTDNGYQFVPWMPNSKVQGSSSGVFEGNFVRAHGHKIKETVVVDELCEEIEPDKVFLGLLEISMLFTGDKHEIGCSFGWSLGLLETRTSLIHSIKSQLRIFAGPTGSSECVPSTRASARKWWHCDCDSSAHSRWKILDEAVFVYGSSETFVYFCSCKRLPTDRVQFSV